MLMSAKFEGLDADDHRVPAYEGAQALVGISRGVLLTSHYLVTGEIRKRIPFDDHVQIYLRPSQPGSFENLFDIAVMGGATFLNGAYGINLTTNMLWDGIKWSFNRAIGRESKISSPELNDALQKRNGDFDALLEAVEPALTQAHNVIGLGAGTINISIQGDNNTILFNPKSKKYLKNKTLDEYEVQVRVSVSSYNGNSRHGRVYVEDLHRTVPFDLLKDAPRYVAGMLSRSLDDYVRKQPSDIVIKVQREFDDNDELLRYIVVDAYDVDDVELE